MERNAHRVGERSLSKAASLSAAERAAIRWGFERVRRSRGPGAGERDLARTLQRALRHLPVVMLHDRRLPGGLLAEHLAIGPGGVTIVAGWSAGDLVEPLAVECLHGIFGARAELLRDGTHADRTALVTPLHERVIAVRDVVAGRAPVGAALCLRGDGPIARLRPLVVEGVMVGGPNAVAQLAAREGTLLVDELTALVDRMDAALPPAL